MVQKPLATRMTIVAALLIVALLTMSLHVGAVRLQTNVASAAELEAQTWYTCTPVQSGAFGTRIHVRCSAAAPGGILFFAYPTRDATGAARYLSLISTAVVAGKQLSILYDTNDASGAAYGCGLGDCRPILALILLP